jgi:hypothetical protein
MEALELCIVIAYFLVPLFSAFVVRRFSHHLLDRLREELYWFSLLTFLAGVRHLGTVTGWLHDEAFLTRVGSSNMGFSSRDTTRQDIDGNSI